MEKLKEQLKNYLINDVSSEEALQLIQEFNSWDGRFDGFDVWENDEEFFDTFFSNSNVMELVRAMHFGDYNFYDDLVGFNAYGNLTSYSYYDYLEDFKACYLNDVIDSIIEFMNNNYFYFTDEIKTIIEEWEESQEEAEDHDE